MGSIYVAALIVGLGIAGAQAVLSGDDAGHGHGDLGHGPGHGGDGHDSGHELVHGHGHPADLEHSGPLAAVLSLRFWIFGLLGFGLFGTLLHLMDVAPAPITLALSIVMGIASGSFASFLFRYVARTGIGSGGESVDLLGQVATVVVPLEAGRRGKVRIEVRGRTVEYLATTDAAPLAAGERALVEDIDGNELRVGKLPPELGE